MEIKIRYTWRRKSDGEMLQETYDIKEVESMRIFGHHNFNNLHNGYDLIARDLWMGQQDEKGADIFANDEVAYDYHDSWSDTWKERQGVVEYENGSFYPVPTHDNIRNLIVTGNIHKSSNH